MIEREFREKAERLRAVCASTIRDHPHGNHEWEDSMVELIDECVSRIPPPDDGEPSDSLWAEGVGFAWSGGGTLYKKLGPFEVLLTGDTALCEKRRGLSLLFRYEFSTPKISQSYAVDDDPTRGQVRRLDRVLAVASLVLMVAAAVVSIVSVKLGS